MRKQHVWTVVIAAEPPLSILSKADGSDRTELLALLDLIQSHSRAISKRSGENGPVAKRARADLVSAVSPSEDEVVRQHVRDFIGVRIVDVVSAQIEWAVRPEWQ